MSSEEPSSAEPADDLDDIGSAEMPDEEALPGDQIEFVGEEEASNEILDLGAFGESVLWGTDWTVETIVAQLKRGNIEINPRFQRRDAWTKRIKSRFVESIILGLPVPQVVLAETREQRGKYVILDGKQRLLSLMQFSGLATESKYNGFGLTGLEVRKDLSRKKFRHLEKIPILRKDLDAFQTYTIRAIVIRNWPSIAFLHVVFQRLNTGSLKLSPQELRQAVAPGEFTYFADDATIAAPELHRLLGRDAPDPRMRDVELLVRFVAFQLFLQDYGGRMKEFLDNSCLRLNDDWRRREVEVKNAVDQFRAAIVALESVFGPGEIARKHGSRLFNRSIFDALIFYAAQPEIRGLMLANEADVRAAYQRLIMVPEFQDAVESDTAGLPHTAARLSMWGDLLADALKAPIPIVRLVTRGAGEQRLEVR